VNVFLLDRRNSRFKILPGREDAKIRLDDIKTSTGFEISNDSENLLAGRKQKSSPNVAQTGSIRRKNVRIPVEPINK
jgi:hypothetical protein